MSKTLVLSPDTVSTAGVLLLTVVVIEYGGWFLLRVVRGHQPATSPPRPSSRPSSGPAMPTPAC